MTTTSTRTSTQPRPEAAPRLTIRRWNAPARDGADFALDGTPAGSIIEEDDCYAIVYSDRDEQVAASYAEAVDVLRAALGCTAPEAEAE